MKETLQDLVTQKSGDGTFSLHNYHLSRGVRSSSSYVCGTRLARIDFPIFNGEHINQ